MRVLETNREAAEPIERFESHGAWSQQLGSGAGESHVYVVHFDAGGEIGPHEAGFDQLFVVVEGSGWGAAADGVRTPLVRGQAARYRRGEVHSKGSESGMKAIMIQIREMQSG